MKLRFDGIWQQGRWVEPAFVTLNSDGVLVEASVSPSGPEADYVPHPAYALPGMINGHSHAFQYAMAGLSESLTPEHDSFWTWREKMYQLALTLDPEMAGQVAAALYAEMLRLGFTHVVEFHYLHQDPAGNPYTDPAAMAESLLLAAERTGMGMTLVPVYYETGDFGRPANAGQRRFLSKNPGEFLKLWERCESLSKKHGAEIGWGIHSLRACPRERLKELLEIFPKQPPFHLHIAEQVKEVRACENYYGKRPVEWLLDEVEVNERFHLVHATHLSETEVKRLLASKARVVLCPSTEGNLGDGFFESAAWQQGGGSWTIGTDSHIGINPFEELRWLEYGTRLRKQSRNVLCTIGNDCGESLFEQALAGGASAAGLTTAEFKKGQAFNAVAWSSRAPLFASPSRYRVSQMVFAADPTHLYGTLTRGQWRVRDQKHHDGDILFDDFRRCLKKLW